MMRPETWPRERPKGTRTRMGRGQFKLIADALKRATPTRTDGDVAMRQWRRTVSVVADALSGTNPAFQRGRFIAACGFEP